MIESVHFQNNQAHVTYTLSDDDMRVLLHLKEHGYMEFKQDADSSIVNNLCDMGFVTFDEDAWHQTYILTDLGQHLVQAIPK